MRISDETWGRAVDAAASQFENYWHRRYTDLDTPEQRRNAIGDALQHAIGVINLADMRNPELSDGASDVIPFGSRDGAPM